MGPVRPISAGLSDIGRRREINEDYFLSDDDVGLYVVADGVGGHAKGEVASREAVDELVMWVRRHLPQMDREMRKGTVDAIEGVRRLLESGVQQACYMIYGLAELDPAKRGMSTTLSVLLLRNTRAFVAQVGDSRVYRLRGKEITQLTEDHTLVNYKLKQGLITPEEAKSVNKNVITRAVGHRDYVEVDTSDTDVTAGDQFFLCTDGFHNYLEDDAELCALMHGSPAEIAHRAVELANGRGGRDNITAVVVFCR
jgi:serine/threonine protein phosphatase PrpC